MIFTYMLSNTLVKMSKWKRNIWDKQISTLNIKLNYLIKNTGTLKWPVWTHNDVSPVPAWDQGHSGDTYLTDIYTAEFEHTCVYWLQI